jgi:hypothetical protein
MYETSTLFESVVVARWWDVEANGRGVVALWLSCGGSMMECGGSMVGMLIDWDVELIGWYVVA